MYPLIKISNIPNTRLSADPSGVERVGENENPHYPITETPKYQNTRPEIPTYQNSKTSKYQNIRLSKISKYLNVPAYQNIERTKYPIIWPLATSLSISLFLFPRGLGHQLSHGHDEPGPRPKGQRLNGHKLGTRAIAWGLGPWPWLRAMPGPWPRHKPNRQRPKAKGHKLGAMAQDI